MSVEVVMPQMGESITEGTVSKWLKKVGDHIGKDEAILEISTDKVDAEVPSPGEGTLLEIRHQEGDTVEVGTVLAVIGAEGEQPAAGGQTSAATQQVPLAAPSESEPLPPVVEQPAVPVPVASAPPETSSPQAQAGDSQATDVVMPQ